MEIFLTGAGDFMGSSVGARIPGAQSLQLPRLAENARTTGKARHIGRRLNRWSTAHIADVAGLYRLAVEGAEAGLFCFAGGGVPRHGGGDRPCARPRRGGVPAGGGGGRRARARLGWSPRHGSAVAWIRQELVRA